MTEVNSETQEFPIRISFTGDSKPLVFDLSGAVPFELYMNARRNAVDEADPRDLVLLKTGSVFDFPAALNTGLLELVDEATGNVVTYHDGTAHIGAGKAVPRSLDNNTFITIPTDIKKRDRPIQSIPLSAASCLRSMVQPERSYHLRLRDKNLGVRWWTWGERPRSCSNINELPPSERHTIISVGPPRSKSFNVKSEIPIPTKLFIGLSLADQTTIHEQGSNDKALPPTIKITITNTGDRPIVLKTIGDQPHLKRPGEITNPRARVTHARPALQNFSVVDQESKEDLISNLPVYLARPRAPTGIGSESVPCARAAGASRSDGRASGPEARSWPGVPRHLEINGMLVDVWNARRLVWCGEQNDGDIAARAQGPHAAEKRRCGRVFFPVSL